MRMPGGFWCQTAYRLHLTNTVIFLPFNALNIQNPSLKGELFLSTCFSEAWNILKIKGNKYCRTDQTAGHDYLKNGNIKKSKHS